MAAKIPAYDGKGKFVFVSYSHKDSDKVYPIISTLIKAGYNIWYDQGVPLAVNFGGELYRRIKGCSVFLLFVSKNSVASDYVDKEVENASALKKKPVRINIDDSPMRDSWYFYIPETTNYISIDAETSEFYGKLSQAIAECRDPQKPIDRKIAEEAALQETQKRTEAERAAKMQPQQQEIETNNIEHLRMDAETKAGDEKNYCLVAESQIHQERERVEKQARKSKRFKILVAILASIILPLGVIFGVRIANGISSFDNDYITESDFDTSECSGNSFIHQYNGSIFYSDGLHSGLRSISIDGSTSSTLVKGEVDKIVGYNEIIVYSEFESLEKNSLRIYNINSGKTETIESVDYEFSGVYPLYIDSNWIYYDVCEFGWSKNGYSDTIYRVDHNGQNPTLIYSTANNNSHTVVVSLCSYKDYIYVNVANLGIVRLDSNGSHGSLIIEHGFGPMAIHGDKIYYSNQNGIFVADIDGNNSKKIRSDECMDLLIIHNKLVYTNAVYEELDDGSFGGSGGSIYTANLDGSNKKEIRTGSNTILGAFGNWVYSLDYDGNSQKLYRVRLDGSYEMEMPD